MSANSAWSLARPIGGMIPRKRETFKGPLRFARIGHSSKASGPCSYDDNLASPWWLSAGTAEHLWGLAKNSGTPLSALVRQQCCVPFYWNSSCDLLFEVELSGYIDAWVGPGTFFFSEKHGVDSTGLWPENDVVFLPSGQFPQIFIPGIWDPIVRRSAWRSATVVPLRALDTASSFLSIPRTKVL